MLMVRDVSQTVPPSAVQHFCHSKFCQLFWLYFVTKEKIFKSVLC